MSRGDLLLEAHKIINGERLDAYGVPEDSFADISTLWNWWLSGKTPATDIIDQHDVAVMMALLKLARHRNKPGYDNLVDACGYLALANG